MSESGVRAADGAPWRIAVVGAGYFSQFHLQGWRDLQGVEIVGLCDRDDGRAAAMAERFGIDRVFTEVDAMLDATAPTLVDIVTPPGAHTEVLSRTLARRLPAICQKPFCANYWQAAEVAEQARRANVPVVVHENFRFMPWFRETRRLLDGGLLGRPFGVSFRLRPGDGQGARAYLDRQPYFQTMPRLLVAETAVHFIDTFRYLLGDIVGLHARLRRLNPAILGEDAAIINFDFADGATGLFDGNRLNDHPAANMRRTMGEMWLEGSSGVLRLDGDARLWWKPHGAAEAEHVYDSGVEAEFGSGACGQLQRHVIDCLSVGRTPENAAEAYMENLRVQEAVYESHRTGRRVPMADFEPRRPIDLSPIFER